MLVNFEKYLLFLSKKYTIFISLIFRTPPDPRLKKVGLYCAYYDEAGPPVRPIGSDGTRSRIPLGPPRIPLGPPKNVSTCCASHCSDESGEKRRVTQLNDQEKYASTITKDVIEEDNSPSGDPQKQEVFECNICDADGFVR